MKVSLRDRTAYVEHWSTLQPTVVVEALNEARLGASLKERGESDGGQRAFRGRDVLRAGHAAAQAMLILVGFALGGDMKQAEATSSASATGAFLAYWLCIALSYALFRKAWSALRSLRSNVELLMAAAMGGTLLQGKLLEAAMVGALVTLMDLVTFVSMAAVDRRLRQCVSVPPSTVTLQGGASIPSADLKKDMVFVVRAGDGVPADGVVVKGQGTVDESRVTGEPTPVDKSAKVADTKVYSGSVLQAGFLEVRALADVDESFQATVMKQVADAHSSQTRSEALVSRFAVWYTPAVILVAVIVAVVQEDFNRFLVIIVAGCPCALLGAAPFVQAASMAVLAGRHGLLIKEAVTLESLAKLRWLGIDKTGTITTGHFSLLKMRSTSELTQQQLHQWATALETRDTHPLAQSVVASYTGCRVAFDGWGGLPEVKGFKREGRCGVTGQVDGRAVGVGNRDFLAARGIPLQGVAEQQASEWSAQGTTLFITVGQSVGGMMLLEDTVRGDAEAAVSQLKALGVRLALLTGDNEEAGRRAAAAAGIETVHAGLLPADKARLVLQAREGPAEPGADKASSANLEEGLLKAAVEVGFVGDGLNDCPALASASVGIAVQEVGSQALADASAAILQGDIGQIPAAIKIARRSRRLVIANVALALLMNAAVMIVAALRGLPLWLSVVMDNGTLLVVLANSLWPLCWRVPPAAAPGAKELEENGGRERFIARGRSDSDVQRRIAELQKKEKADAARVAVKNGCQRSAACCV